MNAATTCTATDKARAVAHYSALAAEAEALAASRRANPGRAAQNTHPTADDCAAVNAANDRTAKLVEAAIWLTLALAIGGPLAWWLLEWAACGSNRMGC